VRLPVLPLQALRLALIIRDARAGERDAIEAVTLAAYQQYATTIPALWEAYRQNIVSTLAAAPPDAQIVAEDDGRIVGSVLLYRAGTVIARPGGGPLTLASPEVRLLAVAPEARGKGIGAALMHECVARARASGAARLTLHTTEMMQSAVHLYERMGFVHVPELDFRPGPSLVVKGYRLDLRDAAPR
jgi:GNAT superfamily N-acetyltransferase